MVHFRKRFDAETLKTINEEICRAVKEAEEKKDDDNGKPGPPSDSNKSATGESTTPEKTLLPSKYIEKTKASLS